MTVAQSGSVKPAALLLTLWLAACSAERAPAPVEGAHPTGWADPQSSSFHAQWLAQNGFPLTRCQQCHGDDYAGGAVGVSCSQASCHAKAPTTCTTCHGANGTPRPATGAHWAHVPFCDTCHSLPVETTADVERHASGTEAMLLTFSGLAIPSDAGVDAAPAWDPTAKRCTNTYCHGAASPSWTDVTQIGCDGCHAAPPTNHAPWARVASSVATCTTCHPSPTSGTTHVNGTVDVTVTNCTTCHGSDNHPNPPLSLAGSSDPTTRGVGAHERHLDGSLVDRISAPLPCNDCHVVPTQVVQAGHFDQAETPLSLPAGGTYDRTAAQCNVWCHFNRTPGPTWTDNSGAARKCDACHAFPPVLTRDGAPHPTVAGELSACVRCHLFGPSTHVNGVVDFVLP